MESSSISSASKYPYPSDLNPTGFVTVKLSGEVNFRRWKLQMLCLIESRKMSGFIDGTIMPPPETILPDGGSGSNEEAASAVEVNEDEIQEIVSINDEEAPRVVNEEYGIWKTSDRVVKGWILGSLTEEILDTIKPESTAKDVWMKLENSFGPKFPGNDLSGVTPIKAADIEAVKRMVERNPDQLWIGDENGTTPFDSALYSGNKKLVQSILNLSADDDHAGEAAANILEKLLEYSAFMDIALDFVQRYPHAARFKSSRNLTLMAREHSNFRSGMHLNFLESFIFSCVPLEFERRFDTNEDGKFDVENPTNGSKVLVHRREVPFIGVHRRLNSILWDAIEFFVPFIKYIRRKKLRHHRAIQLVRCLCEGGKSSNNERFFEEAIVSATEIGNIEVLEAITTIFPTAYSTCYRGQTLIQLAVHNRCEKSVNFLCQQKEFDRFLITHDYYGKNTLQTVGELAPPHKLNLISGAALQMRNELQWFQGVDSFMLPSARRIQNSAGETAAMVFTRTHRELKIEGEKWMKDTANACTITAALITTIVFAAAITVPGGNNGNTGHPLFSNGAFQIFGVFNLFSFVFSTTSLILFLSILTARCEEQDFLHSLPKRLAFGLITLFLSITSMVITFWATVFLVFLGEEKQFFSTLVYLSSLTIAPFVGYQLPLLIDLISLTYGHGPFGKIKHRRSG